MNSSEYSQSDILLHIVKCNFINMDNKSMKYNEVIASVLENYQINITKDELTALLKQYAFCFVTPRRDFLYNNDILFLCISPAQIR